jgi:hypothetical protein
MEQSIASYLFRNNYCVLPGIGKLSVVTTPADTDFINGQIKAPVQNIIFSEEDKGEAIFNELSAESEHLKMMLDAKRTVSLSGIGIFTKNDNGNIHFSPLQINQSLVTPVKVERVIHQNAQHTMLVGDKETTNVVMTEYFTDVEPKKKRWWIAAIIMALVSLLIIGIYFYSNGGASIGNAISIQPASTDSTYHLIK